MSTKAKIGKDWVKCQVVLQETGETLHLTFAPGQTKKKVVVHIDGRTDVGYIELWPLHNAAPPYDATLTWKFEDQGVRAVQLATVREAKPVAPPKPATVVPATPPKPEPVVAATLPPPPEEIVVPVVQDSAVDNPAAGGKRGRKPTAAVSE